MRVLLLALTLLWCVVKTNSLNVTVSAVYTPAPGEVPGKLGPDEFTAGSVVSLKCVVEGQSGDVSYSWSLTGNPITPGCSRCSVDTSSTTSTLYLGVFSLYSYYAGNYTCSVGERGRPNSHSSSFTVKIVGESVSIVDHGDKMC